MILVNTDLEFEIFWFSANIEIINSAEPGTNKFQYCYIFNGVFSVDRISLFKPYLEKFQMIIFDE